MTTDEISLVIGIGLLVLMTWFRVKHGGGKIRADFLYAMFVLYPVILLFPDDMELGGWFLAVSIMVTHYWGKSVQDAGKGKQAEKKTTPPPKTAPKPSASTATKSGTSTAPKSGTSTAPKPGTSTASKPAASTATKPGTSTATKSGTTTATKPSASTATKSGTSTTSKPAASTATKPGTPPKPTSPPPKSKPSVPQTLNTCLRCSAMLQGPVCRSCGFDHRVKSIHLLCPTRSENLQIRVE